MRRTLAALAALLVLGLGSDARAIAYEANLSLYLEGAFYPVDFRLPSGDAVVGPAGTLQFSPMTGFIASQPTFLYGPGFYVYLALFGQKGQGLSGTLAPSKGPGGAFGGSVRIGKLFSSGRVSSNPYTPACFGLPAVGQSLGVSPCGGDGTLVTVTGWTTLNVTVTGMGAVQAAGSDARTPGGLGQITLVTPIRIEGGLHPSPLAGFATLSLAFVPEPGTLALTGAGALCLAVFGRRRTRSRRG